MNTTEPIIDRSARIARLVCTLTTDPGLIALRQLANIAEWRAVGTGPAHDYAVQLRRLEREIVALRRALTAARIEDATHYRELAESRIAAFQFGPVAPLPAAVAISDTEDEKVAPGLSTFEPVETEVVTVDLEDDYHSTEPAVIEAARKCFGAMSRHGLSNDDQQMRLAVLAITGEFYTSRKQFTAATYEALTKEINAGAWECKPGMVSWYRVLFTEKPEARGTRQMGAAA